jgi:hypothetical protein
MNADVVEQKLEFVNKSDKPMKIILEPWAEECVLEAGEQCSVLMETSAEDRGVEVHCYGNEIVVHFGTGATAEFLE